MERKATSRDHDRPKRCAATRVIAACLLLLAGNARAEAPPGGLTRHFVRHAALSPDGAILLLLGRDGSVGLFEIERRAFVALPGVPWADWAAFHPARPWLASLDGIAGRIDFHALDGQKAPAPLPVPAGARGFTWIAGGERVVLEVAPDRFQILDAASGTMRVELEPDPTCHGPLVEVAGGTRLAPERCYGDHLSLWDAETGRIALRTSSPAKPAVTDVTATVTARGDLVVRLPSIEGRVAFIDPATGAVRGAPIAQVTGGTAIAIDDERGHVATASGCEVRVAGLAMGGGAKSGGGGKAEARTRAVGAPVDRLFVVPGSTQATGKVARLIAVGGMGEVMGFELPSLVEVFRASPTREPVLQVVADAAGSGLGLRTPERLGLYRFRNGTVVPGPRLTIPARARCSRGALDGAALSPAGGLALVTRSDGAVGVFQAESGRAAWRWKGASAAGGEVLFLDERTLHASDGARTRMVTLPGGRTRPGVPPFEARRTGSDGERIGMPIARYGATCAVRRLVALVRGVGPRPKEPIEIWSAEDGAMTPFADTAGETFIGTPGFAPACRAFTGVRLIEDRPEAFTLSFPEAPLWSLPLDPSTTTALVSPDGKRIVLGLGDSRLAMVEVGADGPVEIAGRVPFGAPYPVRQATRGEPSPSAFLADGERVLIPIRGGAVAVVSLAARKVVGHLWLDEDGALRGDVAAIAAPPPPPSPAR